MRTAPQHLMTRPDREAGRQAVPAAFFPTLVAWQKVHGRHGLPWQGTRDPYRVWLSEIMLQQTQVSTVLGYYPRFLTRFPDVHALAAAHQDDVLALWSGLGYYSRARNLHRCAQEVVERWDWAFPCTAEALQTLHGIGPSTAAAIAAFCFGERVSILDGNVRRVLTRLLAFEGDLADAAQERQLWQLAQDMLPPNPVADDMAAYTQGLMDLGATLCTRGKPQCLLCPVAPLCQAREQQRPGDFPVKTRKLVRRTEEWWLAVHRRGDGAIWLAQRPQQGIWAGLYCLPVHATRAEAWASVGGAPGEETAPERQDTLRHALTHRDLVLQVVEWPGTLPVVGTTAEAGLWVRGPQDLEIGLPAPVRQWLLQQW